MSPGSEEHLRFITLTVAIDYQRPADQLWDAARATYRDEQTRYLFDPLAVANTGPLQVSRDMQRHRLSKKQDKDARIWQTGLPLHRPCRGPAPGSPLWVRMLHDNCGVQFDRLTAVGLPVDVHTAQATLQIGAVHTSGYRGPMGPGRRAGHLPSAPG